MNVETKVYERVATSVIVLNEVLYRLVIGEISEIHKIDPKKAILTIKKNPSLLKSLGVYKMIEDLAKIENLEVAGISANDLLLARDYMPDYCLLSNDSLHLAVMKRLGINNIATNDKDFERVDWIKIWKP